MNDGSESGAARDPRATLTDTIREVKNAAADRTDVVVDLRDAARMRLELLASELQPVFSDVPDDVEIFDFAISSGLQPRLWIDAVSHVAMGRDKRTYSFVRDTRVGRVVLAESSDMRPVAEQVTRYIAERIVERQRMLDGSPESVLPRAAAPRRSGVEHTRSADLSGWPTFLAGLYLVGSGILMTIFAALLFLLWHQIGELFSRLPL